MHLADAPQVWHITEKTKKAARRPPSQDSCNYIQAVEAYLKFLITPQLLLRQRVVIREAIARQDFFRYKPVQIGVVKAVLQEFHEVGNFLRCEVQRVEEGRNLCFRHPVIFGYAFIEVFHNGPQGMPAAAVEIKG